VKFDKAEAWDWLVVGGSSRLEGSFSASSCSADQRFGRSGGIGPDSAEEFRFRFKQHQHSPKLCFVGVELIDLSSVNLTELIEFFTLF
jgi:hypothetical protein